MECPECGGEMMEIIKGVPRYRGKRGVKIYPAKPREVLGHKCIKCGKEIEKEEK